MKLLNKYYDCRVNADGKAIEKKKSQGVVGDSDSVCDSVTVCQ